MLLAMPMPPGSHPDHPALKLAHHPARGRPRQPSPPGPGRRGAALLRGYRRTSPRASTPARSRSRPRWCRASSPRVVEARAPPLLADTLVEPPSEEEVERARQIATADWVFGHEKVHQQAISAGLSVTLFDLEHLDRHLEGLLATDTDRLLEVAAPLSPSRARRGDRLVSPPRRQLDLRRSRSSLPPPRKFRGRPSPSEFRSRKFRGRAPPSEFQRRKFAGRCPPPEFG